jgi:hypothetical protein
MRQSNIAHNSHAMQARVGAGQSMSFKYKSQPAGSPTDAFHLLVEVVRDRDAWKICNPSKLLAYGPRTTCTALGEGVDVPSGIESVENERPILSKRTCLIATIASTGFLWTG